MSIPNILEKINPKRILALYSLIPEKTRVDILYISIVVLVGGFSFGMGYLAAQSGKSDPIIIQKEELSQVLGNSTSTENKGDQLPNNVSNSKETSYVVASSKGTKYHYPWCSGSKNISPKNKVTYKSAALAEKAGYTLASNCK